jgi:subtilisin family serine protease
MSLAGPPDRLLQKLLDVAIGRGIRVVGAADPAVAGGGFPASWPGVVSVASDPGPQQLSAPGRDIPAPLPGGRYGVLTGSSYAAAHVSGVLALIGELKPRMAYKTMPGMLDPCAVLSTVAPERVCQ